MPRIHLPPPHVLLLGDPRLPSLLGNLLLRLEPDRRLAAPQADEPPHLAALVLQRQLRRPVDGAGVVGGEVGRGALVVEVRELLELLVGEEPELEDGAGEGRVDAARGDLDQRGQVEGHLVELVAELRVLGQASLDEGGGSCAADA